MNLKLDDIALRVGFSNREHYINIQHEEDSVEEAFPNLENIYIELDDQGWGGYGGINQVKLEPNSLVVELNSEMKDIRGRYNTIKINFSLDAWQLNELQKVLNKIMYGYEKIFYVIT